MHQDNTGQVIISGISGVSLNEEEKDFLQSGNIGGVVLFSHNYESPAQLAELVNSIQQLRDEYPLFVSVDHEGGRVQRFKEGFSRIPSLKEMSSSGSPKLCFEIHKIIGEELKACGVNFNFSPVTDVLTNPSNTVIGDRSFGPDPEVVTKFISAAIRGLQTSGVIACSKHFPGHGMTLKDSHHDLPIVKTSLDELENIHIYPFSKAAKSRVEAIMVAHLMVDAIDDKNPSSLSPAIYEKIRSDLKFNRIIITDDMEMSAITDRYTVEEASVAALKAGADIVLFRTLESAKKAYESIQDAFKRKELLKKDIDEKLQRILDLKKKYLSEYKPIFIPDLAQTMNTAKNQKLISELLS